MLLSHTLMKCVCVGLFFYHPIEKPAAAAAAAMAAIEATYLCPSFMSFQYQNIGLICAHAYFCYSTENCVFFSLAMHLKRNMFVLFSASTLISLQNTRCTQRTIWIETENVTFMRFQPMFFFSLGAFSLCRSHRSYGSSCRSSV